LRATSRSGATIWRCSSQPPASQPASAAPPSAAAAGSEDTILVRDPFAD